MIVSQTVISAAIALGIVFGTVLCWRPHSTLKLVIKTASTALLAVWAALVGGPILLVAGLALSSLGDFFLGLGDDNKWLLPGMGAFFSAHVAYIALFLGLPHADPTLLVLAAQIALVITGFVFVRWLWPSLADMRWPVFAYAIIILLMGAAALRLETDFLWVMLGALMFIVSDVILSIELFRKPEGAPARIVPSVSLWFLYFGGQALIAYGTVMALA